MARQATIFGTLTLLLLALPAAAGEPAPATSPNPPAAPTIPDVPENAAELADQAAGRLVLEPAAPAAEVGPAAEMLAIEEALAAGRAHVAELTARLRGLDDDEAVAVQREIEQSKQATEIEVLRIQAKYARLAGREEQAAAIEAELTRLPAPTLPPAPADGAAR